MGLICTTCDRRLAEGDAACPRCSDEAVIAKSCCACGETIRLGAALCIYCNESQPGMGPKVASILVEQGRRLMSEKRCGEALVQFEDGIRFDETSVPARLGRAFALRGLRNIEKAANALEEALSMPQMSDADRSPLRDELASWRAVLAPIPRSQPWIGRTGVPWWPDDEGARQNAKVFVCRDCQAVFGETRSWCRCGVAVSIAKRCTGCGVAIDVAGTRCPWCGVPQHDALDVRAGAARMRGERLIEEERHLEAVAWFTAALEIFPGSTAARLGNAVALRALGREEEALTQLWRALDAPFTAGMREAADEARSLAPDPNILEAMRLAARLARDWTKHSGGMPESEGLAREERSRRRLGAYFRLLEESITKPLSGRFGQPAHEPEPSTAPGEPELPASTARVAELLASADRLADAGELGGALAHVERALAIDIATPGGTERWRRWGAVAREAELARHALIEPTPVVRDELRKAARELEATGAEGAAAVAWALAGDERARLRLLAKAHVCEALAERLAACCRAGSDSSECTSVTALVREGHRRSALDRARSGLIHREDAMLAEIAALVLALAVHGPRLDLWIGAASTATSGLLGSEHVQLALGDRVTLGRLGASIRVTGPGVAPEHVAVWRDEAGQAWLGDVGTALGTTLAGARLGGPLPIGSELRVELGGRVPVRAAPLDTGRERSPIVVEAGGEVYLLPLGTLTLGAGGELCSGAGPHWTLWLDDAPPPDRWVTLRPPAGTRAAIAGAAVGGEIQLCFGDVFDREPDGPALLAVRPPNDDPAA